LSGQSSHTLTDEEHEAIKVALEWKPMVDMGTHKVTRESRLADLAKRQRKLNKLHEANTPEPIEALKATKVSKANAKIKASRKKMFSKAVANDVKDAAVAVNQWFDEEPTRKRSVHKEAPLIDDIPDMPGTPLPEPLKDPSPLPKPTPELEQEPSNMQETIEISQDELEEAMENQRAIERLRQKLQDHSHKQSNDQDTII
ncbi:MAG: hypothetical protein FWD96_04515, partial [Defluviitaleaceae bacterium]|nr:hypothetical protein [Defluviitaleaceae bacterium]